MKNEKNYRLLRAIGELDERFVAEADPCRRRSPKRIAVLSSVAACLVAFVTALSLWLFLPFDKSGDDLARYEGSEYYELIKALDSMSPNRTDFRNNFDLVINSLMGIITDTNLAPGDDVPEFMPSVDSSNEANSNGAYVETTDNQVEGVIEGDILKRTEKHAFYITHNAEHKAILVVYELAGESSRVVCEYLVDNYPQEMYLSADGRTATIVTNASGTTTVISLDVSEPEEGITEKGRITVSGNYSASRLSDSRLLLTTSYYVGGVSNYDSPETFVPTVVASDGTASLLSMSNIVCPHAPASQLYAIVTLIDPDGLEIKDCYAALSYYGDVYATKESVYLYRTFSESSADGNRYTSKHMSEILRLEYSDEGLSPCGSVVLEGSIKNQYNLDEHKGVLRAATSISENVYDERKENGTVSRYFVSSDVNASLWLVDCEKMELITSVERFAPKGEQIMSVRFDGDVAYVCTAIRLSDPVFRFDLSDINNITVKDTGTIDGYSSSLVQLNDGFLLGIGYGGESASNILKLEIYREADNGLESVAVYEQETVYFSENYKSYLIDREKNLFGLGSLRVDKESGARVIEYLLLHFDGEKLEAVSITDLTTDGAFNMDNLRVFIRGEYLYIFVDRAPAGDSLCVVPLGA